MRPVTFSLLLCFALLGSACSGVSDSGHPARRDGPEFSIAFPDAGELVTTSNLSTSRSLLATVPLPETAEHHDQLRRVLDGATELSTDHLLLLTEAVAIPRKAANVVSASIMNGNESFYWSRTKSGFAPVVDELLLAGIDKLNDPSPANFGRLLLRTQSKAALLQIVEQLEHGAHAEEWDDGSPANLEVILGEIRVDSVRAELCVDALLPAGRLGEARMETATLGMSFDAGRLSLLHAGSDKRQTLAGSTLLAHVKSMSFDGARLDTVRGGAPLLDGLEGSELVALVRTASFDGARVKIAEALAQHTTHISPTQALQVVNTASFDSGREKILKALLAASLPQLGSDELISFMGAASFDPGRIRIAKILQPHWRSGLSGDDLQRLMRMVSFDSARDDLVGIFEDDLRSLPPEERVKVLMCFSFESARENVRGQLNW